MLRLSNPLKWTRKQWLKRIPLLIVGYVVLATAYSHTLGANAPVFWLVRSRLQNMQIPADWKLVSTSENRGTLGIFCPILGGGECPYYSETYEVKRTTESPGQIILSVASVGGFFDSVSSSTYGCNDARILGGCNSFYVKGKYELGIFVNHSAEDLLEITIGMSKNTR